jgi:hypothetical protein
MTETKRNSIGKPRAIELYDSGWWEGKSPEEICDVQLFTEELCMPFGKFHEAITKALGRPVYTHEFGLNYDGLVAEYLGDKPAPTMEQILDLLPRDKTIVLRV